MKDSCIFCSILEGEIPSFTVYEDRLFKVILDRYPASSGHMLIIPKNHFETILDMPQEEQVHIYKTAQKMAVLLKEKLGVEGINIVQNNGRAAGQTVDHFHLHLIPRFEEDEVVLNKTTHIDTTIENLQEVWQILAGK